MKPLLVNSSSRKECVNATASYLIIFLLSFSVFGQSSVGSLRLRITDARGQTIVGATVTIINEATQESFTSTTSDDGIANFVNIKPGSYRIRVEAPSFKVTTLENVRISIAEARSVELSLVPGEISVTVESERRPQISALPNFNNDLTPLLSVVPGAVATGTSALGKVVIDGKGKDQTTVRIDGLDSTQLAELPSGDSSLDAASSFQKPEVAFDADNSPPKGRAFIPRLGPGTGSVTDGVTFAGNDTWRAQVYGEHRNGALNARNFFDSEMKEPIRRTRFGGKLGGPLIKNKAFLYLAYEGWRGRTERAAYEAVPAEALCACGNGAIASLTRAFIPTDTNIILGASMHPDFLVAKRILRSTINANSFNIRLDHPVNSQNQLFFRFTQQAANTVVPDGVTGRTQHQRIFFNNGLAKFDHAGTDFTHSFRFGINQTGGRAETKATQAVGFDTSSFLITTSGTVNTTALPGGQTSVPIATLGGLVKGSGRGSNITPTAFIAGYDLAGSFESHKINLGAEARSIHLRLNRLGGLTYVFPNAASLRAGIPGSVNYVSDLSSAGPFSTGSGARSVGQNYFLTYLQLEWPNKTESRLKFIYGLRYDYFGATREKNNRALVIDPLMGTLLPTGTAFYSAAKNNFQPRFSLSYKLSDAGIFANTIFRAGVGIYSGVPRIGDLTLPVESDRFNTGIIGGTFPIAPEVITQNFLDHPETRQFQPLAFARSFRTPERAFKWEGSLTRPLRGIYDLRLLYTGNIGRDLPIANIGNPIISVQTNVDPTKSAIVVRQFDIVENGLVKKPFGEFFYRSSEGRSNYNGLSIQLSRNDETTTTLPKWLNLADLNIQYTLSANRGNVTGSVVSNPLNLDSDYGYNAADARHSFTLSGVLNLWEAVGLDPVKGRMSVWGGWKIIPYFTARSGFPLQIKLDRPDVVYVDSIGTVFSMPALGRSAILNTPGGGATSNSRVPDVVPGEDPYLHNDLELLNPAAFSIPAPGTFGMLRRGAFRGRSSVQLDLGLTRYLFSKEKTRGELRVDFFNIFNHPNFNNPVASLPSPLGTGAAEIQPRVPFTRLSAGSFGIISAADSGRVIQLSFTLRFNEGFSGN